MSYPMPQRCFMGVVIQGPDTPARRYNRLIARVENMMTRIRRGRRGALDARTLMAGSGELRIGAYVRRQRIRKALLAATGVGLIVVAVFLYRALQSTDGPPEDGK